MGERASQPQQKLRMREGLTTQHIIEGSSEELPPEALEEMQDMHPRQAFDHLIIILAGLGYDIHEFMAEKFFTE
jgi:hypothetical protein